MKLFLHPFPPPKKKSNFLPKTTPALLDFQNPDFGSNFFRKIPRIFSKVFFIFWVFGLRPFNPLAQRWPNFWRPNECRNTILPRYLFIFMCRLDYSYSRSLSPSLCLVTRHLKIRFEWAAKKSDGNFEQGLLPSTELSKLSKSTKNDTVFCLILRNYTVFKEILRHQTIL